MTDRANRKDLGETIAELQRIAAGATGEATNPVTAATPTGQTETEVETRAGDVPDVDDDALLARPRAIPNGKRITVKGRLIDDDHASVLACCVCGGRHEMVDGSGFAVDEWVVCPCCLHPVIVVRLCDEDHAHTEVLQPDFDSSVGREEALLAVRRSLELLPESNLTDEAREEFVKRAKKVEQSLLTRVN